MAERTTDLNVASHRRFVLRTIIPALKSVFSNTYDRDPQFANLKITPDYPFKETDYPAIMVEYQPQRVVNAGVGHEEWFTDAHGVMRKWHHSRFEGIVTFGIFALSTLDRDILADAVTEVIRFGRLDPALLTFFTTIYGDPNDPNVELVFNQLMLNADEVDFGGNNASPAPWQSEDMLVYSAECSTTIHGGYYNVVPVETWEYVTAVEVSPWEQEVNIVLPFDDPQTLWTNPFVWEDENTVASVAVISGSNS